MYHVCLRLCLCQLHHSRTETTVYFYRRKSTLVNQVKKPLEDLNGYFIEGKFDKHARPDTVLASAIDSFFGKIVESKPGNSMESMKWRIHDAIGSGSISVLPNLQKWLNGESDTSQNIDLKPTSGIGSSLRLKFMFCNIIGAVASKNSPLVMFLDDLQWADEITVSACWHQFLPKFRGATFLTLLFILPA